MDQQSRDRQNGPDQLHKENLESKFQTLLLNVKVTTLGSIEEPLEPTKLNCVSTIVSNKIKVSEELSSVQWLEVCHHFFLDSSAFKRFDCQSKQPCCFGIPAAKSLCCCAVWKCFHISCTCRLFLYFVIVMATTSSTGVSAADLDQ